MTFQQVNNWHTESPSLLDRELNTLEDNITTETNGIRASYQPLLTVQTYAFKAPGIVPALPDTQLSCDTTMGAVTAVLPALNATNFGRRFVIINRTGTHKLSIVCADTKVKLNASTFPATLTSAGVMTFYCDAAGYYL